MLAIRLQRNGRKKLASFRIVVQDSRRTPTSGNVVCFLGSFDPHSKKVILNQEKAQYYLDHGAQPSDRIIRILKENKVKLPGWVKDPVQKTKMIKNPDKRRSTRPVEDQPLEEKAKDEVTETAQSEPSEEVAVGNTVVGADTEAAQNSEVIS
jgi:small subunit ribosomal protein S16